MSGADSTNQMATPFDFVLNALDFITSSGQTVDLRGIFVEINIYQDIFSNVMSGNIVITDSTNIFAYLVQQGSEFIHISLDKPGLSQPLTRYFRVYSRKPEVASPSNQTIRLNFCSEELLVAKAITFSKVYNNMLISDMANDVAKNILKISNMNKVEQTTSQQNITLPYFNPLQTLNWLASKATSSYVGATYMFFENNFGYNFQSLQQLQDVSGPFAIYNCSIKNIADNNPNLDYYDVSRYQVINTPDTLESLITGRNSSRLLTLDILRQKFTVGDLNADDLFKSSVTLGNAPAYNNFQNRLNDTPADSYGGYRKFYPTNVGQNQATYIQGKQQINQTNVENWLVERNAQIMQMLGNRIKIVVPGNITLNIGQVIQFNLPSIEPQVGNDPESTERKLDPYMTGLWLITAIRHRVTITLFETVIELCRDSVQQAYPGAQNSTFSGSGLT
jgi:hypothetical protein